MKKIIFKRLKRIPRKVLFMSKYFLFQHRKTTAKLKSYGLSDIRVFQIRQWVKHIEINFLRYNYKARFGGKYCFVKLASDVSLKNEIYVNKHLQRCGIDFIPKYLMSDESYDGETSMLITDFLSDLRTFELPKNEKHFESICEEFISLHSRFLRFKIIHGDINKANMLLNHKNHIILIDFGMGRVPGSHIYENEMKKHFGTYYTVSGDTRIYDDAYSFIKTLEECGIPPVYKRLECYEKIVRLVGTHTLNLKETAN